MPSDLLLARDGLLAQVDATDQYCDHRYEYGTTKMDETKSSAEWVFKSDARLKDYHKNMTGGMFLRWLNMQLGPSFEARYPGKKMNLFLDNAPYHTTGPIDFLKPSSLSKNLCVTELIKMIDDPKTTPAMREEISVIRAARVPKGGGESATLDFGVGTWHKKSNGGGPSTEEVQEHLEAVVKKYFPARLLSSIEIYFQEKGWTLIFTPPYMPKFQPIERCWGYSKNGVAEEWKQKRTLQETQEQLLVMWYGGKMEKTGKVYKAVGGEKTGQWIKQCERDMDTWIKKKG